MEEAAVSQTIRNWKLLSDLKKKASSVYIKGEEALADFSVFSKQNMYAQEQELPIYEQLINRISFINQRKPLKRKTKLWPLQKKVDTQKPTQQQKDQDQRKITELMTYFLSIF